MLYCVISKFTNADQMIEFYRYINDITKAIHLISKN